MQEITIKYLERIKECKTPGALQKVGSDFAAEAEESGFDDQTEILLLKKAYAEHPENLGGASSEIFFGPSLRKAVTTEVDQEPDHFYPDNFIG